MPLSDKTLAEMEAGALALANQRGEQVLPAGYMEAMIRTQERHRLLKVWEKEGKITIERVIHMKGQTDQQPIPLHYNLIHCGDVTFDDMDAESRGAYPSEVLIANIALALSSGIKNDYTKLTDWKVP